MKICFLFLFLLLQLSGGEVHRVARINEAKTSAEEAFKAGRYKEALEYYINLTDSFKVKEEPVLLNKAHCYFKLNDVAKAKKTYQDLAAAKDKSVKSIAHNQLGLLAYKDQNLEMAQNYFKSSLKAFPHNQEARYNYELVTKLLKSIDEKEEKNKDKKNENERPQEPSAFAKKLKEQAESLSGSYKYEQAYELMVDGVKKDKSVLFYKDFMDRLKVIADLSKM